MKIPQLNSPVINPCAILRIGVSDLLQMEKTDSGMRAIALLKAGERGALAANEGIKAPSQSAI
jgi:hypothetical protein